MWKSLTQTAPKVSSKIIPIDSCAVFSSFTMFLFVSFIILCNPKLSALYFSIQILPSRSPGNLPSFVDGAQEITAISHIGEKRMLSAIRSNLNYFDGANGWRVMATWIQLGLMCWRRHSRFKRVKNFQLTENVMNLPGREHVSVSS